MIEIRKTEARDLEALMPLFDEARGTIAQLGIDQWQNGYPNRAVILADIERSQSYCVLIDGEICGTFALITDGEPTYNEIFDGEWLTGDSRDQYFAIHRVAISVKCRGKGVSTEIINYCADKAKKANKTSLRIDTHRGNVVMRKMLEKHGFIHCGTIYLESGDERVAYEKIL
ncbi:MAG: GNAT family N-acetyltransferase [Ruminococcaceae bacterium]|nr:GNAT family N-acetyltransferase [Oscillospiraceae bacterium]